MKKITINVLVFSLLGLLIYDVVAIVKGGTESSISSVIIRFSYDMPFFTFMAGVLCGHLFWRMRSNKDTKEIDDKQRKLDK